MGTAGEEVPDQFTPIPVSSRRAWATEIFERIDSGQYLEIQSLTAIVAYPILRRVLTGHIVAFNYGPVLRIRQQNESLKLKKEFDRSFLESGETLTAGTARIYKQLVAWGETKPASILALAEGSSVTTVHNRLQQARKAGLLPASKPGARRPEIG